MATLNEQSIQLSAVIERAILLGVGFDEAESLYSEAFRSPESFSATEAPEMLECMICFLTEHVYPAVPAFCDYEENYCEPEPIAFGMSREDAIAMINGGLRFVDTCNYKGEGEGVVPECLTSGMRVFVSKHNYM